MTAVQAEHSPAAPEDPRDFLHLLAIRAWQALAAGRPAPAIDPMILSTEIDAAFDGDSPVYQLCDDWLNAAREHGLTVDGADGELLDAVTLTLVPVIAQAFWAGLTVGHHAIAGGTHFVPRRLALSCGSVTWGGEA